MKPIPLKNAFLLLLALVLTACSLPFSASSSTQPPVSEPPQDAPSATDTTEAPLPPAASETPAPAPTQTLTPTQQGVVITATGGSLAIRRGPSIYYNLLGYLQDGQSATATARNSAGDWLYIPIPSYPSLSGWVAAGTQYSTIQGDINSLPVMSVAAAEPIYIRNCTFHPMLITPINVILAPQFDAPANSIQVTPGDYAAYDQSQEGHPQVKAMSLSEGDSVDINTDGLNNTYTCP